MNTSEEILIEIKGLKSAFGDHVVHESLDLDIKRGEVLGVVGGSGSGKTTLLREIIMLQPFQAGSIHVFGQNIAALGHKKRAALSKRWGVMFQQGALFSSLTVLENVTFPLYEFTSMSPEIIREIAMLKIALARFPADSVNKYPSELSGGMIKRAAIARAIVMDPELLFLDEPTAGLDPQSAAALDKLVLNLHQSLGLTIVIVTHDLDTLWAVTNRVAFLGEKRVLAVDTMANLSRSSHPLLNDYFSGPRARVVAHEYE